MILVLIMMIFSTYDCMSMTMIKISAIMMIMAPGNEDDYDEYDDDYDDYDDD